MCEVTLISLRWPKSQAFTVFTVAQDSFLNAEITEEGEDGAHWPGAERLLLWLIAENLPLVAEGSGCRRTGPHTPGRCVGVSRAASLPEAGEVCGFRINTVTWSRIDSFSRLMAQMVEPPNND